MVPERQEFLVGGEAEISGVLGHGLRQVALDQDFDAAAPPQHPAQLPGVAAEVQRQRKRPGHVVEPVGEALRRFSQQKDAAFEPPRHPRRRPVAVTADGAAVEYRHRVGHCEFMT